MKNQWSPMILQYTRQSRAPTEPGKMILQKGRIYRMVLCLHTATRPGRNPCLAETVWTGSRERFLFSFGNWSNMNREWGLLARDSLEREQREVPGPVWMDWAVSGTSINGRKVTFDTLLKHNSPYISIIYLICIFPKLVYLQNGFFLKYILVRSCVC